MRPSTTARRYAEAAFAIARQDGDPSGWLRALQRASQVLQEPAAAAYLRDPGIGTDEKLAALNQLLPDLPVHVLNLLRLLVTRQRTHLVPAVSREFEELDRQARGVLEAEVTVARRVDDAERQEIVRRLSAATGKRVEIHLHVDPRLLGGIVVQIGDRLIDASVAGRLRRLRQEMVV